MSHFNRDDIFDRQAYGQNLADLARSMDLFSPTGVLIASGNRLRITNAKTFLATRFAYDEQPQIFSEVENVNGSVIYQAARDGVDLQIGTSTGDKIYRSSNEFFHYQPYRETQFGSAFKMPSHQDGQRIRVGAFFDEDGIYFERDENGDLFIVRRTRAGGSTVNNRIAQSDWNVNTLRAGDNHMKNPSGIVFDEAKIQMIKIGLLWYGAGYAWVGFQFGMQIYICHIFQTGNEISQPTVGEPTVPVRWEIENLSGVSSQASLETYGASAIVETGEFKDTGFIHGISNGVSEINTNDQNGAYKRIITIRPKATFKSKTNRTKIEPIDFAFFAESQNHSVLLVRDVPITNSPTWQSVGSESAVEYATDAQGVNLSQGVVRIEEYVGASNKGGGEVSLNADTRNPLVLNADGTVGNTNLAVFAKTLSNSVDNAYAAIRWLEIQ